MLVYLQVDVEGFFYVGRRAFHVEDDPVGMPARYGKSLGLGEVSDRLVILFCGPEQFGELSRGQVFSELSASRIVKLLQQIGERDAVAQGQPDGQAQVLVGIEPV